MASPPASDFENIEEQNEPPPPGGDVAEESRAFTPMDDEKPAEEKKPSPQVKPSSAPQKTTAATVNNLAMLAQKAPLLALLGGNPLGLLGENIINYIISILIIMN